MDSSDDDYDEVVLGQTVNRLRPAPPAAVAAAGASSSSAVSGPPPAQAAAPAAGPSASASAPTAAPVAVSASAVRSDESAPAQAPEPGVSGGSDNTSSSQVPAQAPGAPSASASSGSSSGGDRHSSVFSNAPAAVSGPVQPNASSGSASAPGIQQLTSNSGTSAGSTSTSGGMASAQQQALPPDPEQQREISMRIGNAAVSALTRALGRDEAVAEVTPTVASLMPNLNAAQAATVAGATVDSLLASQPMLQAAAAVASAGPAPAPMSVAPAASVPSTAAPPAPTPASTKPAVPVSAVPSKQFSVSNPLANSQAETAASRGEDAITAVVSGDDATRAKIGNEKKTDPTESSGGETGKASEELKKKRNRTKFANQQILAGPELYDPSGKLLISGLSFSSDDVVDVPGIGPEEVQKIRGVITSVPRPSKQKDWYDIRWFVKDAAVLQLLQSKVPSSSKNRDLLKAASVDVAGNNGAKESKVKASGAPDSASTSRDPTQASQPKSVASSRTVTGGSEKENQSKTSEAIVSVSSANEVVKSSVSKPAADDGTTGAAVEKAQDSKLISSDNANIPTASALDDDENIVDVNALAAKEPEWDDDSSDDNEQKDESGVRVQCTRCKKWHILPDFARDDKRNRVWFCEHNVYDPNIPPCPALKDDPSAMVSSNSEVKKSTSGGKVCKTSPNLYDDYVKNGRPSRPAGTKMAAPHLVAFLFETHVIPILIRGGWAISKKARVVDESDDAKRASKDLLYVPPGVEPKAPFVSRKDYFDSKKGFMNYLESDKCKNDPLAKYALEFYNVAERVVKKEKAAAKESPREGEAFDDMASRINAKVDKKTLKALKKAKLSLPPGVRGPSSKISDERKKTPEDSSSDNEVLASYQSKNKGKKKQKRPSSSPVVFSLDSDDGPNDSTGKNTFIKATATTSSPTEHPIFDNADSSGDEKPKSTSGGKAELIVEPGPNDVLIHGGGSPTITNHDGNKNFRALISERQEEYLNAAHKDKKGITQSIVNTVVERGGRFLRKASDGRVGWVEVDAKTRENKAAQDLRVACQKIRSESKEVSVETNEANSSPPLVKFKSTKKLPEHVVGTNIKLFPSKALVRKEIVAPLVKSYRCSTTVKSAKSLDDDEIITVDIEDAGGDDQVIFRAEGIKELEGELKMRLEEWINVRENAVLDELEANDDVEGNLVMSDDDEDYDDDEEDSIECRYRLDQEISKVFPDRTKPYAGKITMLPDKDQPYYYRVFYPEDSDEEDIHVDDISRHIVNDLGPPEKKPKRKKKKVTKNQKQSKARKPSSPPPPPPPPPQEADSSGVATKAKARAKVDNEEADKVASKAPAAKPPDTGTTSAADMKEARKHFKAKYLRARRIEYDESGLNLNAVNKSMWRMHRDIFGDTCDDDCECPSSLNLLVDTVRDDNEDHFKSTYKAVGFAKNFAPKFYDKLKREFPHASPTDLLKKLEKMWLAHVDDDRFGLRCKRKCACGKAWKSLFLDQCLRPKKQSAIPKKKKEEAVVQTKAKESIPKKAKETIPTKKRHAPEATSTTSVASTAAPSKESSGNGNLIPKKKRKTEAASISKSSGLSSIEASPVPKKGMTRATNDSSIVPLRKSGNSALTQRIKRKDRDDTPSTSSLIAASSRGAARAPSTSAARSAPSMKMKEYSVSFNSKEPLGFFVITENQNGRSVCKITSVSPKTTAKEPRIQEGTIVVGTGIVKTPVSTHGELRRKYEEERSITGGDFILHFINADVTASNVPKTVNSKALGSKKGDWSTSGAFRGFSRVGGWDGCSKKLQNQQDLEGAKELRSSRARHMPSVSRYMPRGSMNSSVARPLAQQVSRGGNSIRGIVGPVQSILRKDGDATTKVPAKESSKAAKDNEEIDEDAPKDTKIKFMPDEDLEQVKIFSQEDDHRNIIEDPVPPPGLRPGGNDALSYAIEHKTYEDVLALVEKGAHVNTWDSEGIHPMDRATRKYDALKKQKHDLKARPASQVVVELERVEGAMRDADLKYRIMKLYRDSERIIDLAEALKFKMWCKMEITVEGVRRLDLTPKAKNHPSKNMIFHQFHCDGGHSSDGRAPSMAPLEASSHWPNEKKYVFEFKNDTAYKEEHETQYLDITLFKGDPNGPNLRLTKWRDSVDRIRNMSKKLEEVEGELHKNEFIHNGCLVIGLQVLEMDDELIERKRSEIIKGLPKLMDKIDAVRKDIVKDKNGKASLPGNISIPLSHNLSLLHAAVFAHDEDSIQRLLDSYDADPTSLGLYGTALSLAVDEMEQARDGNSDPQVIQKLKRMMDSLRKAAAAKEKAATVLKEVANAADADAVATEAESQKKKGSKSKTAEAGATNPNHDGEEKKSDETSSKPTPSLQSTSSQGERNLVIGVETSKRAVSNLPAWMSKEEKQASQAKTNDSKTDVIGEAAATGKTMQPVLRADMTREEQVSRIPLPMLSNDHWLPEVKKMRSTKNRRCGKFEGHACHFGVNCRYAHVHGKVGPVLDSPTFTPKQRTVDDFVPQKYIYTLTRSNDRGERYHTAAFCHSKDDIIYYAERGQGSFLSRQGVYWYRTMDYAMQAVQRVVYCIVSPEGTALRKSFFKNEDDGKRKRADDNNAEASLRSSSKRQKQDSRSRSRPEDQDDESVKKTEFQKITKEMRLLMDDEPTQRSRSRSPSPVPPTQELTRSTSGWRTSVTSVAAPAATGSMLSPSPKNSKLKWQPPTAGSSTEAVSGAPTLMAPPLKPVPKPSAKSSVASTPAPAPAQAPAQVAAGASSSTTKEDEAMDVSELPGLAKNWVESNHRVHPPIGSVLNNDAWCRLAMSEMEGEKPEGYEIKEELNEDTFDLYYTAAYVDPSADFIYYSEQGEGAKLNSATGVWWYESEEAAKLAVKRVAAAAQKTRRDAAPMFEDNEAMREEEEKPAIIDASKPAVNDDSSLSNMSIDEEDDEPGPAQPPSSKVVDELPILDSRDWIKEKSVRCRYFNTTNGCGRVKSCNFAHVQSPISPTLLTNVDATKVAQVSKELIHQKEALTKSFDLFYTAAYLDPDENVIYYSQGGNAVGVNTQGIWWYSEEEDAIDAVKRVVVAAAPQRASRNASAAAERTSSRSKTSLSQNEVMRRLGKVPSHNLQPVLQQIFPGVQLRRECWKIRHSADGFSVRFHPPRETKTGIFTADPNWRAGTMRNSVWWYENERTAKTAAFMRFLELCVDRGYLKDTAHKLDGTTLF